MAGSKHRDILAYMTFQNRAKHSIQKCSGESKSTLHGKRLWPTVYLAAAFALHKSSVQQDRLQAVCHT